MKKLILSATVAFTVLTTSNIYAQQGFGTNTPDRSSAVDIVSSKRGLLIPRIELKDTKIASPVSKPANALFVYNTATAKDVTPGFYYWETTDQNDESKGRWVRFVSSNSGSAVKVKAGANVKVDEKVIGHDTEYTVSVPSGTAPNQVYVTVDSGKKDDKGNIIYESTWVNPQDFINGSVEGINGITTTIKDGKVQVGLGGDLTKATEITTTVGTDAKTLAIKGLEKLDGTTGKEFDAKTQNIVIMGADGILKQVTPEALLEDAIKDGTVDGKALTSKSITVGANAATSLLKDVNIEVTPGGTDGMVMVTGTDTDGNKVTVWKAPSELSNTLGAGQGVSIDADNKINLGGNPITAATVLDIETTGASLAIKGLTDVTKTNPASNNVVVADPTTGVLKQTSAKELVEDVIGGTGTNELKAKALKGDGITVTTTGATTLTTEVTNSLLKDVTLGIADNAITSAKIKDGEVKTVDLGAGAVTQDKLYAGTKDADGNGTPAAKGTVPLAGENGTVTYQQVTGELLNGKALTSPTGSISVVGGEKALLDGTKIDIKGGTSAGQVLVTKEVIVEEKPTYITEWVTPESLGNTVTASNGLTKKDNDIALGGIIDKATTLTIAEGTKNSDGTVTGAGSLSISGLNVADSKQGNKTVVVQADGKLATVDTAAGNVTISNGGDVNISDNSVVNNYHPSMSEIVIEVTLGETDTNLNLPAVNGTQGQTISVKIVNTTETHKGYLVIKDDKGAFLSEGAMPYQGWIIKSNGTKWIVVGRN
ncbi:hypothetical protein HX017_09220 [Myroides marinus]|uniref:hypothetical protein n=1 Tax=Myroides marinus TaxID=703342 RepID=UPI002575E9EF|nr:hypothetical protein [Myroides marinus]MDM1346807.1 hypothetical protein [Myroides marinus]MDM1350484.1 hypothetical protein [Myroides marinus]MDM1357691.1 hypothetical protein [Myroides marinus]MDM1365126.1 hypothetical protein [Myroides marinus]MDM1368697.1 hypothetical protein [Myroides marinus]